MAVKSTAVSVGTSATRLDRTDDTGDAQAGESFAFFNNEATGGKTMYAGGSDVTTANGAPVAPQSWSPGMDLQGSDAVYACVSSGTAEARVLESGV